MTIVDGYSFAIALSRTFGNAADRRVGRSLSIIDRFYAVAPPSPLRPLWDDPIPEMRGFRSPPPPIAPGEWKPLSQATPIDDERVRRIVDAIDRFTIELAFDRSDISPSVSEFCGIQVVRDPTLSPGVVEIRGPEGSRQRWIFDRERFEKPAFPPDDPSNRSF